MAAPETKPQILTVNVEDYFHVWAIRSSDAVRRKHWDRLDPRLEANLAASLQLLRDAGAKATFFVFGCIADSAPELIEKIVADGHEVASRGYWPRSLKGMGRPEFVADLVRAKTALERAGANKVIGFRSSVWIDLSHVWMLEALAEAGYVYDSSINPVLLRFAGHHEFFNVQHIKTPSGSIWEFPITTASVAGVRVAIAGGNYIRQFPHFLLSPVVERRVRAGGDPVVFYFMPWELDPGQPHISGLSMLSRVRQYRNLAKTRMVFEEYLKRYSFRGVADHMGLPHEPIALAERPAPVPEVVLDAGPDTGPVKEATLVIPLFNEEMNVGYLRRTLRGFRSRLASRYHLHLVLVDDASTDKTWEHLNEHFGSDPDVTLLRHPENRGVAAALLTGLRASPSEIVCSIDCDCSYDPDDLGGMLPLIENADLVTASPYHPKGHVLNVPSWRLFLSKTLSQMYSTILPDRVHTYTSCCRVYRKAKFADIELKDGGFLGVAETLVECMRRGGRVVEYPATLESRLLGESKMKIARTISKHLRFVASLVAERVRKGSLLRDPAKSVHANAGK